LPSTRLSQDALLTQFKKEFDAWLEKLDDETLKRAVTYVVSRSNDRHPTLDLTASVQ
jgi:hypothetical protein